jgi:phosphatidylserine decarboxylase
VLAREGWLFVAGLVVAGAIVAALFGWAWAIPIWLALAFVLQFFRDPARDAAGDERSVVSPADGRIVSVTSAQDPYLARPALKVSVFMNVFNVHSNRSPVDGEVMQAWYHAGAFLNAALDKASEANERNALWFRTGNGVDVTCVQVAGLIARRILCYVKEGDRLRRGERFGFIRFGSRVDIYLPPSAHVRVELGQKVYAAMTILAELP